MSKTSTHYLANGKVYSGPVHKDGSTIMTGAKHTLTSKTVTHKPPKKINN